LQNTDRGLSVSTQLKKAGLAPAFLLASMRRYCLLLPSQAGSATNR
jgi:hypothetical protein